MEPNGENQLTAATLLFGTVRPGEGLGVVELQGLPPLVLAYIGDAVYELWIRLQLVQGGSRRVHNLHEEAVSWVNAKSQARILEIWEPVLTPEEVAIVKRGRNTKSSVPRGARMIDYRLSTGLEALVGYLYLAGQWKRLESLLELAAEHGQL